MYKEIKKSLQIRVLIDLPNWSHKEEICCQQAEKIILSQLFWKIVFIEALFKMIAIVFSTADEGLDGARVLESLQASHITLKRLFKLQ
jgi:hypothetical protein